MSGLVVEPTDDVVERFQERVRPGLTLDAAGEQLAALVIVGEFSTPAPALASHASAQDRRRLPRRECGEHDDLGLEPCAVGPTGADRTHVSRSTLARPTSTGARPASRRYARA